MTTEKCAGDHPLVARISYMRPCSEAVNWLRSLPYKTTPQEAWDKCTNYDWMLWVVLRSKPSRAWSDDRKPLVRCGVDIAELLKIDHRDDDIVAHTNTLRAWADGTATKAEVVSAIHALDEAYKITCNDLYTLRYSFTLAVLNVTATIDQELRINGDMYPPSDLVSTPQAVVEGVVRCRIGDAHEYNDKITQIIRHNFSEPPIPVMPEAPMGGIYDPEKVSSGTAKY